MTPHFPAARAPLAPGLVDLDAFEADAPDSQPAGPDRPGVDGCERIPDALYAIALALAMWIPT